MRKFLKTNTFLMIVSAVFAIIIWVYVVYQVNPMYDLWLKDVPVSCNNVSNLFDDGSMMITGTESSLLKDGYTIHVKVRGKRSIVSSLTKKDITCTVDMTSVTKPGTYTLKINTDSVKSDVDIIRSDPYTVRLVVEQIKQKDIEVKLEHSGTLPEGYTMENLKNQNDTVKITGAASAVEQVKSARVLFDYSILHVNDTELNCPIEFFDKNKNPITDLVFKKSVASAKLTFELHTVKEVTVILMPKYENEVKTNYNGKSIKLKLIGNGTQTADGGLEIKLKLRGTLAALQKYTQDKKQVYTEPINVSNIYANKTFENISAAPLANGVEYESVPVVNIDATPEEFKEVDG